MYQVFWGDFLLHDLRLDDYYLKDAELSEELNKVAEFTFKIYPSHPNFNKLEVLVSNIIIKKDSKIIFKGRIISDKMNMDKSKQVTCESVLAFLFDSVQRPFEFQGTPEELFTQIINNHNLQVEEYKKFKIGKLTGANHNNNDYIKRSSTDYINTFNTIEEKILNLLGGYIQIRYEDDGNYIDWVDDFTDIIGEETGQLVSSQVIEFGENLIDITANNDAAQTYSVVIPLGAEIEKEDGTKERITIKDINNGKDYLVNQEALSKYGWIVAPISETTWNDITIADSLKTKAQEYLNNNAIMLKSTLELNALDLNVVDNNIKNFEMGVYIQVKSTPHNLSKTYLLTKKETPLTKPENMKITLGETTQTLTGIQVGNQKDTINKVETILSDYVLNDEVTEIVEEKISNSSYIEQLPDKILTNVSQQYVKKVDFNEYKNNTSEELTQAQQDITNLQKNVEVFFPVLEPDLVLIPTFENGLPKISTEYFVKFSAKFEGEDVTPIVTCQSKNEGITLSITDKLTFSVNSSVAIPNKDNKYELLFTYTKEEKVYSKTMIIYLMRVNENEDLTERLDQIVKDLNNNYPNNEELEEKLEGQKATIIEETSTMIQQSASEVTTSIINKVNTDGVTTLKNTLVTIDINGINVAKNDEDVVSLMDNKGVYVSDGKLKENESNLLMKTDRNGAYFKSATIDGTIKEQGLFQKEVIDDPDFGKSQAGYYIGG